MPKMNLPIGSKGMPVVTASSNLTLLEIRMLKCIREFRRLNNQTVRNVDECNSVHLEADSLLTLQPELDDKTERFDDPYRVNHRDLVDKLFHKRNWGRR